MTKHEKTLQAIFEKPTRSDIEWREIEALFRSLGAGITQGAGSRVRVTLKGAKATFHRPHPRKEAKKHQLKEVPRFLEFAGFGT